MSLHSALHDERVNAAIAWTLTGVVAVTGLLDLSGGDLASGVFWVSVAAVTAIPAALSGDWTVIVPWPLPLVGVLAVALETTGISVEIGSYLALVTLAFVVVVELDIFTPVHMSRRFTVAFAAMTTLAVHAWWTVLRYYSDVWLGSEYLGSQTDLQWEIVSVTVVSIIVAGIFVWYLDRFEHFGSIEGPLVTEESP